MATNRAATRMANLMQPTLLPTEGYRTDGAPVAAPSILGSVTQTVLPTTSGTGAIAPSTFAQPGIEPASTDVPLRMANLAANYHQARLQRLVGEVSLAEERLVSAHQSGDANNIALRSAQLESARDSARSVRWWLAARQGPK